MNLWILLSQILKCFKVLIAFASAKVGLLIISFIGCFEHLKFFGWDKKTFVRRQKKILYLKKIISSNQKQLINEIIGSHTLADAKTVGVFFVKINSYNGNFLYNILISIKNFTSKKNITKKISWKRFVESWKHLKSQSNIWLRCFLSKGDFSN